MLGSQDTIVSLSLYELADNEYADKIKRGAYWELLKEISGIEDDQNCYTSILESFKKIETSHVKFVFAVSALNVFVQNNFTGPMLSADLLKSIEDEDSDATKRSSTINNAMYPLVRCMKLY